jgi:hypothetical protein
MALWSGKAISAVNLYAEVSGAGGGPCLSSGLTSLDGILVPTFGAYDLAVTLLFPLSPSGWSRRRRNPAR